MSYSQNDPAWKNETLGPPNGGWTIGAGGCLLTALAEICRQLGHPITPLELNAELVKRGLMTADGDMATGDGICQIFPDILYVGYYDMSGNYIDKNLMAIQNQDGVEGILKLDYSPAEGLQTHFCRLRGLDPEGNVVMDDSWDGQRCLVKDRYLKDEIKNIWGLTLFKKNIPAPVVVPPVIHPTPEPIPEPTPEPQPQPIPEPIPQPEPETPAPEVPYEPVHQLPDPLPVPSVTPAPYVFLEGVNPKVRIWIIRAIKWLLALIKEMIAKVIKKENQDVQ